MPLELLQAKIIVQKTILDTFLEQDLVSLGKSINSREHKYNITKQEHNAIKKLKSNCDLVIRKADKGGTIIILNGGLYKKLSFNFLSDTDTYVPLTSDPTKSFKIKLKELLTHAVNIGVFNQQMADRLCVSHPLIPLLHSLPKYHKGIPPPPIEGQLSQALDRWGNI